MPSAERHHADRRGRGTAHHERAVAEVARAVEQPVDAEGEGVEWLRGHHERPDLGGGGERGRVLSEEPAKCRAREGERGGGGEAGGAAEQQRLADDAPRSAPLALREAGGEQGLRRNGDGICQQRGGKPKLKADLVGRAGRHPERPGSDGRVGEGGHAEERARCEHRASQRHATTDGTPRSGESEQPARFRREEWPAAPPGERAYE